MKVQLYVDPQAKPRYYKAHLVPYSMQTVAEQELYRLVGERILEPAKFADWASPIVPVLKADGCSVGICDFQLLNQACKKLIIVCSDGRWNCLSKLDLGQAYQQVLFAEESRKCVVVNTHRGLFCYNRMPFCVSSVLEIFHCIMENLLKDIPGLVVYIDDIHT